MGVRRYEVGERRGGRGEGREGAKEERKKERVRAEAVFVMRARAKHVTVHWEKSGLEAGKPLVTVTFTLHASSYSFLTTYPTPHRNTGYFSGEKPFNQSQ